MGLGRREGGGGAAEGSALGRGGGVGIPGPNGIVRGGGNGALIRPTDGVEVDDKFDAAPCAGADSWLRSSLMIRLPTLLHSLLVTPVLCTRIKRVHGSISRSGVRSFVRGDLKAREAADKGVTVLLDGK